MLYTAIYDSLLMLVCVLLVLFVLVQNAKGRGLVSSLGGDKQRGGIRLSRLTLLGKFTWTLKYSDDVGELFARWRHRPQGVSE